MSAVAIPMDSGFAPRFRSAATWSDSFGPDLTVSAMMNHNFPMDSSDSGDTPPSSTASMASSPSHSSYILDHEMRRQRSRVQHTPRFVSRSRQLSAGPYSDSSPAPSESSLPTYQHSTPATTVSVLSDSISSVSGPNYVPSFNSPMPEPPAHGHVYGQHYQQPFDHRSHAYAVQMEYQTPYPPTTGFSNHTSGGHGHGHGHGQTNPLLYSSKSHQKFRHGTPPDQSHVKVIQSRPKPRCWDHGCNGRQFSTFSNLLRHQREKSGQATKSTCPNCGAEFTRTTARNGHLMHDKCKRRNA